MQYIQYTLSWFNPFAWTRWYNNKMIIQNFLAQNLRNELNLDISKKNDIETGIQKKDINMLLFSLEYLLTILDIRKDEVYDYTKKLISMPTQEEKDNFINTENGIKYKSYVQYSSAKKYLNYAKYFPEKLENFYKHKNDLINNTIVTTVLTIAAVLYTIISAFVFFSPILIMLSIGFFMLGATGIALTKTSHSEYQKAKSKLIESIKVITPKQENINDLDQECIVNVCKEIPKGIDSLYLKFAEVIKQIPDRIANPPEHPKSWVYNMADALQEGIKKGDAMLNARRGYNANTNSSDNNEYDSKQNNTSPKLKHGN